MHIYIGGGGGNQYAHWNAPETAECRRPTFTITRARAVRSCQNGSKSLNVRGSLTSDTQSRDLRTARAFSQC